MFIHQLEKRSLQLRQIWIWGDIEDGLTFSVMQQLSYLVQRNKQPVYLLIHSSGGDLDCTATLIDEIIAAQRIGLQIWTIAMGTAYSAAASILALGTKGCRMARPNSAIMLHPYSYLFERDYKDNQRKLMNFVDDRTEQINKTVAKACGMNRKYKTFLRDIDKGLWLNAQQAVAYGVVDNIWTGPLPFGRPYEKKSNQRTV